MGPDLSRYTVIADSLTEISWADAETAIDTLDPGPGKTFGDGSTYSPLASTIEGYHEAAELDDHRRGADPEFLALIENAGSLDDVRAVLRADLHRLRGWLNDRPEGQFSEGYAVDGDLRRIGSGFVLWAQADLRHFVCPIDGIWFTLSRLSEANILDAVAGLRPEYVCL